MNNSLRTVGRRGRTLRWSRWRPATT